MLESRRRRRLILMATGVALTLAASGCSGSGSSTSASSCSSPGVTSNEIKVGLVYPDTGHDAPTVSPARSGVQARIARANADGGIHGRKIVLQWRDDASVQDTNLVGTRDLVEHENVFGVIQESAAVTKAEEYLAQRGVPVTGLAVEPVWDQGRNMFAAVYPYGEGATSAFGRFAKGQGGTKAFVVALPLSGAAAGASAKLVTSVTSVGIPVVGQAEYTDGVTSASSVAARFASSGADVLVAAVGSPSLVALVAALNEARIPFKAAFGPEGYDTGLLRQNGAALAGMTVYVLFTPFESHSAAIQTFQRDMATYAPEIAGQAQTFAMNGYVGADLFLRGLDLAGACPTRAGFIKALRSSTYDAGGLLPAPVNLSSNFSTVSNCYVFMRVNSTGSGFEAVPNPNGANNQWCGEHIATAS
jgi:ABC-type branched-subunit amino acid transport system substrate-binding protein